MPDAKLHKHFLVECAGYAGGGVLYLPSHELVYVTNLHDVRVGFRDIVSLEVSPRCRTLSLFPCGGNRLPRSSLSIE